MTIRRWPRVWLALWVIGVGAASAQNEEPTLLEEFFEQLEAEDLASFGSEPDGLRALAAIDSGEMIRARELAEKLIAANPRSVEGHCTLGIVMGGAEGNLPGCAHYLERCLDLFDEQYGFPSQGTPWFWHRLALGSLAQVLGDLGRRDDAFEVVSEIERIYSEDGRYYTAWWQYREHHFEEARRQAVGIIADADDAGGRVEGWNVLCAVEGELGNLDRMYEACMAALEDDRVDGDVDPISLTNAAESARALLRADEAEELLLEATEFFREGSVATPWTDLVLFYVEQGRLSEAVDAMREALRWRRRQHAYVGALNWALQDLSIAHLLLVAGRAELAAAVGGRALERTDRYGRISTPHDEREGWASLFDRAAHRTLAEAYREAASWSGWRDALFARGKWLAHRFRAWQAGRRFVANFADRRLLESRLIPHAPGRVSMPEWLELDLVELLGPGAVEVAIHRLDAKPPPEAVNAYVMAFAAESARVAGRYDESVDRALLALEGLPRWELLLRARLAAGAGASALAEGRAEEAAQYFDLAWQADPGVIRRLGLALPTRFAATGGPAAREALDLLRASPRFEHAATGFEVRVEQQGDVLIGCLHGPLGAVLRCADARPTARNAVETDSPPVQLARSFHAAVFAPRVDLTQLDIRSLDGSNAVSVGSDPRVRSVLDELLGGAEEDAPEP